MLLKFYCLWKYALAVQDCDFLSKYRHQCTFELNTDSLELLCCSRENATAQVSVANNRPVLPPLRKLAAPGCRGKEEPACRKG